MKKIRLMSMNLQFFAPNTGAEGGGDPGDGGNGSNGNEGGNDGEDFDPDNLTDEQIEAIKEKFGLKNNDDVDAIVKSKQSRWQKKLEDEKAEAEKLAQMNADEKAKYELEKITKELEAERRQNSMFAMSREASKMLSEANIPVDDDLLELVVKDDAEGTKKAVEAFVAIVDKASEEKTKAALSGKPPKKNLNPGTVTTKAEIMKIKDSKERQQAIKDNIHLFKN